MRLYRAEFSHSLDPELTSAVQLFCAAKSLFDHLVSAQQKRWGYRKPKRLGGLDVHDHLELGRELHREIARLRADAVIE